MASSPSAPPIISLPPPTTFRLAVYDGQLEYAMHYEKYLRLRNTKRENQVPRLDDDSDDDSDDVYRLDDDSDDDYTAQYMDPEIYRAVTTSNIGALERILGDPELSLMTTVTPRGNTVLHLAASLGHLSIVNLVLQRCPGLLKSKNSTQDLALHLAACAGQSAIVQNLVDREVTNAVSSSSRDNNLDTSEKVIEATKVSEMVTEENLEKNTAAHVALKNHHYEVASILVAANPEVSSQLNWENESPLYLAVEAGNKELVTHMMSHEFKSETLINGQSLVHAAIRAKNLDILDTLLISHPSLIDMFDTEGRTPLSCAANIGFFEGTCNLLDRFIQCTYKRDQNLNGFFPIHMASSNGNIEIIQEFLRRCPDSRELLNRKGQNILHVAAKSGKANVISYMLKVKELAQLINERDRKGNTPLHLAAKYSHPKVVSILTWDVRVRTDSVDNKGRTPLDHAANFSGTMPSFRERLTWLALKYAGAARSQHPSNIRMNKQNPKRVESGSSENYRDRVNTLLLVATLVITVTFAAGFTMPGGYNDSGPHQGKATLVEKPAFQVFLISNTIAMYSSITVAVSLFWAQLGDHYLVVASLKLAMPLLGIALAMVSVAFMTGVYLVVSNLNWLATVILSLGSVFILALVALLIPLFLPTSLSHRIPRYIFYYPFSLLILVTKSNADHDSEY